MILKDNNKIKLPDDLQAELDNAIEVEEEYAYEEEAPSVDGQKTNSVISNHNNNNNVEEVSNYESNQPFFKNKWLRYGLISGAVLILIIIFVLIISSCNSSRLKGFDMTKIPVLYVDEDFDFKIVPTNDIEKQIKYSFKVDDENVAYVKYPKLKGKNVKNTIVPKMAGETTMETKAGRVDSTSKVIVCNRLDSKLADGEHGVKLNKTTDLDLGLGESQECYDNLTFKVSDKSVVELEGISVTGKKAGTATITVSDGKEEIKIKVKVSTKNVYVTSVVTDNEEVSVKVGEAKQLDASVRPSDATNKEIKWISSDTSIATVDSNGVVTGKKTGSATIKAEADDGSGKKVSIKLTVTKGSNNSGSTGNTGNSSSGGSSGGSRPQKTTYYQYRTKNITTISTQMCNYYNARYVVGNYYSVTSYNTSSGIVSNQLGVTLESNNAKNISVVGASGKEYVNFSSYCTQKRNGSVFWPSNPNPVSNCNDWTFNNYYATPKAYITSITVGTVSKSSKINGYQFPYTVKYNSSAATNNVPKYDGLSSLASRFTVSYYAVATNISSAKCSNLNSAQSKFIAKRYTDKKNVITYSDYKWTSNPNLANAEYTGKTKTE